MVRPLASLLILLPLLAGCAAAPEPAPAPAPAARRLVPPSIRPVTLMGIELRIEPPAARPGGRVTLVLTNGHSEPLQFNLCSSILEQLVGDFYRRVPAETRCTRELRSAPAGGTARHTRRLPATLAPGIYRFSTPIRGRLPYGGGYEQLSSEAFEVR